MQIAVLDGATGQVLMHLPSRPKGWDVGGQVLATKRQPGSSDIVLHWVTDLERNEPRLMTSRLLGFSSHGELPSLAIYSTPTTNERQAKAKGHNGERVQLGRVIEALANRQDLRTKFRFVCLLYVPIDTNEQSSNMSSLAHIKFQRSTYNKCQRLKLKHYGEKFLRLYYVNKTSKL